MNFPDVLLYHRIGISFPDNQMLSVSPQHFDRHLALLKSRRQVVPLWEMLNAADQGQLDSNDTAITFDDGYADNLWNAMPLLEKHGCHATVFVTTGMDGVPFVYDMLEQILLCAERLPDTLHIPCADLKFDLRSPEEWLAAHDALLQLTRGLVHRERWMVMADVARGLGLNEFPTVTHPLLTDEQLRELAESPYIEIGAHTLTHPVLSRLSEDAQREEIFASKARLETLLQKEVRLFAYPYGGENDFNATSRDLVAEAGMVGIANTQCSLCAPYDRFAVPRRLVRNWSETDFAAWLAASPEDKLAAELHIESGREPELRRLLHEKWRGMPDKWQPSDFKAEPVSRVFGLDHGTPIDRIYIEQFLSTNADCIKGRVLEIAENTYTSKFGRDVAKSDVLHVADHPEATIVGNLETGTGIPYAAYDCIILTQTIQFIYDIKTALKNAIHALSPGGVLLVTASTSSPISRFDMDRWGEFWRLTYLGLGRLIQEVAPKSAIELFSYGNAGTVRAFFDGQAAEELPQEAFLSNNDLDFPLLVCAKVTREIPTTAALSLPDSEWTDLTVSDDMDGLIAYAVNHRHGKFRLHFRDLVIHSIDLLSFAMAAKDIFVQGIYDFDSDTVSPRVIDGGGHIGLFTLRTLQRYPEARITAFEPDDEARALFQLNLQVNGFSDVEIVPAGLHDSDGELNFSSRGDDSNTLYGQDSNAVVRVRRLSPYLQQPVDFLKLNIEGAEAPVLTECGTTLCNVKKIVLEYHGFPEIGDRLHIILACLQDNGFRYMIHDFDAQTNPATKPPFRINADTRYFLLVSGERPCPSILVESNRPLRVQKIWSYCEPFLEQHYAAHPSLARGSWKAQNHALLHSGFDSTHIFADELEKLGCIVDFTAANVPIMRDEWAFWNGAPAGLNEQTFLLKYINEFQPDVLYTNDMNRYPAHFMRAVRQLPNAPRLILGWHASDVYESSSWDGYDVLLSALPALYPYAERLGVKHCRWFAPGMPVHIAHALENIPQDTDIVFVGSLSPEQHVKRLQLLLVVAEVATQHGFSFSAHLNCQPETLPSALRPYYRPAVFGMDMHKALRRGRIVIDDRAWHGMWNINNIKEGDLGKNDTANMRIFEGVCGGSLVLTEYLPGLARYFDVGNEIAAYENVTDLSEKLVYYLQHEQERQCLADAGKRRALVEHNLEKRAGLFLDIVEELIG